MINIRIPYVVPRGPGEQVLSTVENRGWRREATSFAMTLILLNKLFLVTAWSYENNSTTCNNDHDVVYSYNQYR
jgi:hypothetical protein